MMNTTKFQKLINELSTAGNNRSQIGIVKQQIKRMLINEIQNSNCETLIQELLSKALSQKRLICFFPFLQQCIEESEKVRKCIEKIIIKHIEYEGKGVENYSTYSIKNLLAKYILKQNIFLEVLMKKFIKHEDKCIKIIDLIQFYLRSEPICGNITQVVKILITYIKNYDKISEYSLSKCWRLLAILIREIDDLRQSLQQMIKEYGQLCILRKLAFPEVLKNISILIKKCQNYQYYEGLVSKIVNKIRCDIIGEGTDLSSFRFKYRQSEGDKKEFDNTFENIAQFIYISCIGSHQNGHNQTLSTIFSLAQQITIVRVQKAVGFCLKIFLYGEQNNIFIMSKQLISKQITSSCLSYSYSEEKVKNYQNKLIEGFLLQINHDGMFLQQNNVQTGLQYVIQRVKLKIQNQFEYEFDEGEFLSSCNLILFLQNPIRCLRDDEAKQKIRQLIKMLLNLNESCQAKSKSTVVKKTIELLMYFSNMLVHENQFFKEVLEDLLLKRMPQTSEYLRILLKNNNFSKLINDKVRKILKEKEFLLGQKIQEAKLLWQILLTNNKQLQIENGDDWFITYNYVGRKLYKNKWVLSMKEIKRRQQGLMKLPIQFKDELKLISELQKL